MECLSWVIDKHLFYHNEACECIHRQSNIYLSIRNCEDYLSGKWNHITMISCQKGPTRHAYTLDISTQFNWKTIKETNNHNKRTEVILYDVMTVSDFCGAHGFDFVAQVWRWRCQLDGTGSTLRCQPMHAIYHANYRCSMWMGHNIAVQIWLRDLL